MDFLNDINVDGDLSYNEQLLCKTVTYQRDISGNIGDVTVDFATASTHIVDLRTATYTGASGNIQILLTNGNSRHVSQKVIILQSTTLPLAANLNVSIITDGTFDLNTAVESLVNVASSVVTFTTSFVDTEYILDGVSRNGSGYVENTAYTSTEVVAVNDAYTDAISKLDVIVGRLIPEAPQFISASTLSLLQSTEPLFRLSTGALVQVVTSDEPTLLISVPFLNDGGTLESIINAVADGVIDLTSTDTSNDSLSITRGNDVTGFYDTVDTVTVETADIGTGALANDETLHSVSVLNDTVTERSSNTVEFYKCLATVFPTAANPTNGELGTITPSTRVSGLRVLSGSDTINVAANYNNVTYNNGSSIGFYPERVGIVSSSSIDASIDVEVSGADAAIMRSNSPNTTLISAPVTIADNIFDNNFGLSVVSTNPKGQSAPVTVDTTSGGLNYLIDSVTDVASPALSYVFDHTVSLTANTSLMLINGIFRFPYNNWSPYVGGIDYSAITGWRTLVSKPIQMSGFSRIRINFVDGLNFVNGLEPNTTYRLTITRSDTGASVFNGNLAYSGIGVVGDTEGALVLADSTVTEKIVTFGEILDAGVTATITIELHDTSTHQFSQNLTFTAF